MADQALQQGARAAAGGDLDAQARHLAGLVRAGRLDPQRLAVAAALGDPAARAVLPDASLLPPVRPPTGVGPLRFGRRRERDDLQARVAGLARWGVAPCFQAAAAAVAGQHRSFEALSTWLGPLEALWRDPDPSTAAGRAASLCVDLVVGGAAPGALDQAITAHLLAWGRGEVERPRWLEVAEGLGETPIDKLAQHLLEDALARGATGVRAELVVLEGVVVADPALRMARILHLEAGEWRERVGPFPAPAYPALLARLLTLAGLDPLPGAGPQAGEIDPGRLARPPSRPGSARGTPPPIAIRTEPAPGGALRCELRWPPHHG